jgi:hypothetical protein
MSDTENTQQEPASDAGQIHPNPEPLEDALRRIRYSLKGLEIQVRCIVNHSLSVIPDNFYGHRGEQRSQAILAVRHIEDARMRLGKVIQYNGDGTSCYDK